MQPNGTVAYYTLGCKLNFSETSTIARQLEAEGMARVDFNDRPDVFVINTCSVTDNADRKCRQIVKQAMQVNPEAFVAIIGCYAQLKPSEIAAIPGVDLVLGANEKFRLHDYLEHREKKAAGQVVATEIKALREFVPSYSFGDRTRSFLKVQDGCDYFCAFCTIPLARGRSRSNTIAETVSVAREVAESAVKEVVLTGVNIGDFGRGHQEDFLGLIQELDRIEGIERYRISSIEPNLLSDEIIDFVAASERFVPHFHIPLQSGSDDILAAMRRRYRTQLYENRIQRIKTRMPDACIGVDVIVGFPGETDAAFEETYDFLHRLDVSYLHVFTYSERANTTAIRLGDVVPAKVRQERSRRLRMLSQKKKHYFYEQQRGKTVTVLFEADTDGHTLQGFSENYVRVRAPYAPELVNTMHSVVLDTLDRDGLYRVQIHDHIHA